MSFAILQPPISEFDPIIQGQTDKIRISVNGEYPIQEGLHVVLDSNESVASIMKTGANLVITDPNGDQWSQLVKSATSFSCSVGPSLPKTLGPLFHRNRSDMTSAIESQPILYACENDHMAVADLQRILNGRVVVVPCTVDRICTERKVCQTSIQVHTEPWEGNLIPLTPMETLEQHGLKRFQIPLSGPAVFFPRTQEIADYMFEFPLCGCCNNRADSSLH